MVLILFFPGNRHRWGNMTEVERKNPRRRYAPKIWCDVFDVLSRTHHPNSFSFEDVQRLAENIGITIKRESLRVKLARYCQKKYLSKEGYKSYKITPEGMLFFRLLVKR